MPVSKLGKIAANKVYQPIVEDSPRPRIDPWMINIFQGRSFGSSRMRKALKETSAYCQQRHHRLNPYHWGWLMTKLAKFRLKIPDSFLKDLATYTQMSFLNRDRLGKGPISQESIKWLMNGCRIFNDATIAPRLLPRIAQALEQNQEYCSSVTLGYLFGGLVELGPSSIPIELLATMRSKLQALKPGELTNHLLCSVLNMSLNLAKSPEHKKELDAILETLTNAIPASEASLLDAWDCRGEAPRQGVKTKRTSIAAYRAVSMAEFFHNRRILNLALRAKLEGLYQAEIQLIAKPPSPEACSNTLRDFCPGIEIREGEYIDGIELDTYLPAQKICIEIDGLQHQAQCLRDSKRDEYLARKHGVKVYRIEKNKNLPSEAQARRITRLTSKIVAAEDLVA